MSGGDFKGWSAAFLRQADYRGTTVPDVDGRIARIRDLWNTPIPESWTRGQDDDLWQGERYRRGDKGNPNPGEGQLEHRLLV